MKHVFVFIVTAFLISGCQISTAADSADVNIQGVWDMTHRYFYENGELVKTLEVAPENRQVKIYTATKYMWSSMPRDEKDWHAYGTYVFDGQTLTEKKEYTAQAMNTHSGDTSTQIEKTETGFKQIFSDPQDGIFYAEQFTRIE